MASWEFPYLSGVRTLGSTEPVTRTSSSILNLRDEFNELVLGGGSDEPIGQTMILRRMRKDTDNQLIACPCRSEGYSDEATRDFFCASCSGVGYLWDEELVTGYRVVMTTSSGMNNSLDKVNPGNIYAPGIKFYFPYDVSPHKKDIIVEIELDSEGTPISPYNRIAFYETFLVRDMRGEYGRIIYWICDVRRIAPPSKGETV